MIKQNRGFKDKGTARDLALFLALLLVISLAVSFSGRAVAAPSAHDIMAKNDEAQKLKTVVAHAKMFSGGGGAKDRTKEFKWWRKLNSDEVHYDTLTRFMFPPEVKNEGILFIEDKDSTDVQMYLPAYKKVRRVESGQQSGSFMGSEFSYADIATPHLNDFSYKIIKEEKCSNASGVYAWVIEGIPVSEVIKERTGSSRVLSWVRKDNNMVCAAEYYDGENKMFKSFTAENIKEVDAKSRKWMAHKIKMVGVKTGRFTSIEFDGVSVTESVPDSTFTVQNLAREK